MNTRPSSLHVVVALSGGVDSSLAAALLQEQGWRVHGVTLRLWNARGSQDSAPSAAQRVAEHLGIPLEIVDAGEDFQNRVIQPFIERSLCGETPNPCILCNPTLKWRLLLETADRLGAGYVATGHYARLRRSADGSVELLKGLDAHKDQSYFLCRLTQSQLRRTLFPLGELTKPQVRADASRRRLPAAHSGESQDLCFLGGMSLQEFLAQYAPQSLNPGPILNRQGRLLGEHRGLAFYTIGQRRGLPAASSALYVLEKDTAANALVVGTADELGCAELQAAGVNWISGTPPAEPKRVTVKIRYKAPPADAWLHPLDDSRVQARFDQPLRDITAGQTAAFYDGARLLGGGFII